MEHCRVKIIKLSCGKRVGISISDTNSFYWSKFENEARRKKQSKSELFYSICESKGINQKDLLNGKVSSNIKEVIIKHYTR